MDHNGVANMKEQKRKKKSLMYTSDKIVAIIYFMQRSLGSSYN